jgi:hypothetical protein
MNARARVRWLGRACVLGAVLGTGFAPAREAGAFVSPGWAPIAASIDGKYAVNGTEPGGGAMPPATGTVHYVDGDRYDLTEEVAGQTYFGKCLRRGDVLGCGWGSTPVWLGVAMYRANGDVVDGLLRSPAASPSLGEVLVRERLRADVAGSSGWSGVFSVESREPKNQPADLRKVSMGPAPGGVAVDVVWFTPGSSSSAFGGISGSLAGYGIEESGLLVVGINPIRSAGTVVYKIKNGGRELEGRWVDAARPQALGTETLSRL